MARDSREQRLLKIRALQEAIEELKSISTSTFNALTYQKVVDLANENYSRKLKSKISMTSLKSPTSQEFIDIKKTIEDFRTEHKNFKNEIELKPKKEITKLHQRIEDLIQEIVICCDEKMLLIEQMEFKEKTNTKLKKERDFYLEELNKKKAE